jgi:hypothetical protein
VFSKFQYLMKLKQNKRKLNLPGLHTHRDTDSWARVHVTCHACLTGSKLPRWQFGHGGRRTVAMIAGVKLTPRTNSSLHETQHVAVNHMVAAP